MARLERGKREQRRRSILHIVKESFGIKESRIAEQTELHRRVVNNYLRELDADGEAHREGWYWYEG